jgi:hypothetical protein
MSTVAHWAVRCYITGDFLWFQDDLAGKAYNGKTQSATYAGGPHWDWVDENKAQYRLTPQPPVVPGHIY